jgi:hypothetical protein
MTELRKRMIESLHLRGLSERTQEAYVRAVRQLADHYHKSPDLISEEELRQYFLHIKNVKKYSRASSTIATSRKKLRNSVAVFTQWCETYSGRWNQQGAETIDDAINKYQVFCAELRARISASSFGEPVSVPTEKEQRKLRAYLTVKEEPAKEVQYEEEIRQLSRELRRKAGSKNVQWEPFGLTPAGRECQILVFNGKEVRQVP